ncbi:hypothetical protein HHL16_09250 [Pseudoflavitalea sp. G-6-1-2]|uniref:hypothetical protein n=1 Tax=Pseudoflavitalea sp. G-6-1-2 TaxID=2728841 RepID=UPI00146BDE54|nr:hypothetical protein [Pseudoflavitalea sp. G-6-1-2]NML21058.1 hypothetical protein [Pseudoflavitalea sp. G-6-1-2]
MKKYKANGLATTITRAPLRKLTHRSNALSTVATQVKLSGVTEIKTVTPPSEEVVNRLNAMGKEYPFCVINRSGNHLIL